MDVAERQERALKNAVRLLRRLTYQMGEDYCCECGQQLQIDLDWVQMVSEVLSDLEGLLARMELVP